MSVKENEHVEGNTDLVAPGGVMGHWKWKGSKRELAEKASGLVKEKQDEFWQLTVAI